MKFLEAVQKSIVKKNGMYMVYIVIFLISFIIPFAKWKPFLEMFRLLYALIGFFTVAIVYYALKSKRKPKEDSVIKVTLIFFFVLSSATAFTFFKNFV